jgi:uncharacterized protein (DUF2062 family)
MLMAGKIKEALHRFLSSGLTPQKMAFTVALGVTLGILPILWGTTLICAAAAFVFRLNQAGIQLVNYLSYPLQLALLLPFYRLGERLFPPGGPVTNLAQADAATLYGALSRLGMETLKAVAVWLLAAPLVMLVLYVVFLALLRKKFPSASGTRAASSLVPTS